MSIVFKEPANGGRILHDRLEFFPGLSLAFDDPDAEPYFIAAGWAETTTKKPVRTYTQEEVSIDPATVHGDGPMKGQPVLPDAAKAAGDKDNG